MGNISREMGILRKNRNEMLMTKNIKRMSKIKNAFNELMKRLYMAEKRL